MNKSSSNKNLASAAKAISLLKAKTKSATNVVTLELRETVNAIPGHRVVPNGSCYKSAANINVSSETGGVTTFNNT